MTLCAQSGTLAEAGTTKDDKLKQRRAPRQRESWSQEEHDLFVEALGLYHRNWKEVSAHIGTKTVVQVRSQPFPCPSQCASSRFSSVCCLCAACFAYGGLHRRFLHSVVQHNKSFASQVRSHAQKWFIQMEKRGKGELIPPKTAARKAGKSKRSSSAVDADGDTWGGGARTASLQVAAPAAEVRTRRADTSVAIQLRRHMAGGTVPHAACTGPLCLHFEPTFAKGHALQADDGEANARDGRQVESGSICASLSPQPSAAVPLSASRQLTGGGAAADAQDASDGRVQPCENDAAAQPQAPAQHTDGDRADVPVGEVAARASLTHHLVTPLIVLLYSLCIRAQLHAGSSVVGSSALLNRMVMVATSHL